MALRRFINSFSVAHRENRGNFSRKFVVDFHAIKFRPSKFFQLVGINQRRRGFYGCGVWQLEVEAVLVFWKKLNEADEKLAVCCGGGGKLGWEICWESYEVAIIRLAISQKPSHSLPISSNHNSGLNKLPIAHNFDSDYSENALITSENILHNQLNGVIE
jgi:hypothetical protein